MPTVASYCTVFLKPEMLHIYRQVTGTKRYRNFVITKDRQQEKQFPFEAVSILSKPSRNFVKHLISKHLKGRSSFEYRGERAILDKVLSGIQPDIIHVYFGHTGLHLLPFLEQVQIPCVVSFHGADVMPRSDRPGYLENLKKLLQVIPLVLVRSESLAMRLQEMGCPESKIRINRTGIPLDALPFVDRSARTAAPVRFIQACRLIEKKGLRTTIMAFAIARKELSGSSLVIAGEGPLREEIVKMIAQMGLAPYVQLVGFLDQATLREWFSTSNIFVHPSEMTDASDQEGVPNSLLEAMATGLPVLATRHGGIPEAVVHGETGLLVDEKDVTGLAAAMTELGTDPVKRLEMGRKGSQFVRENFAQDVQVARLEGFYDEAIALNKGA